MNEKQPLEILEYFGISGAGIRLQPLTQGYINDTFRIHTPGDAGFILQRINAAVFPRADLLMQNLEQVLPVLNAPGYRALKLYKTSEGNSFLKDTEGSLWRVFVYIPHSVSYSNPESPQMAQEAGRIVGAFHKLVANISPETLHTPLPGFHDIDKRYAQLKAAISQARPERLRISGELIKKVESLYAFCQAIPFAALPFRVCHNDTKLSNILFDTRSGKALCLIDLDTLMPGYLLCDFGDAARGMLYAESEADETLPAGGADHKQVRESEYGKERAETPPDLQLFEAFVKGWKSSGLAMHPTELEWLCHGLVLMPALHGIRGLTDYLMGDRYYKVAYPEQNRDRAERLLKAAVSTQKTLGRMQELALKILA